jgi:hypothetical protein
MLRRSLVFLLVTALSMGACSSDDDDNDCPDGQTRRNVCLFCGPAGGCGKEAEMCARPCREDADCAGLMLGCFDGVCQVTGCL